MYVIPGATGNTGKLITLSLLAAGNKVRAISRSEAKAKELATEIRNKMGVKNNRTDNKETVKAETRKSPKK